MQAPVYDAAEMRREMRRNKRAIRDAFDYRVIVETGRPGWPPSGAAVRI